MNRGVRLRTDRVTFEGWVRAMPGMALPSELATEPAAGGISGPAEPGTLVPPVVAASLALHGCAETAITLRRWGPVGGAFACFAIAGDLGASVVRTADQVEIGLFGLGTLVAEVVRLVPDRPAGGAPLAATSAGNAPATGGAVRRAEVPLVSPPQVPAVVASWKTGVQLTLLSADAAVAGWQCTLVGGAASWRRLRPGAGAPGLEAVHDVRQELAADLRFALVDCLGRTGGDLVHD